MRQLVNYLRQNPFFRKVLLGGLFLELLSFCAWAIPELGNVLFIFILLTYLVLTLKDLRVGVAIALVELIIGSHGYLFAFDPTSISIAIRHGIFLVLLVVTALDVYKTKRLDFYFSWFFQPWLILLAFVAFSVARGIVVGNGISNVFFDANAFAFLLLALPIWQAMKDRQDIELLMQGVFAGLILSAVKVFFLLYSFSHKLWWMLQEVYRWVRDTRIGEITQVTDQFHRIFFQSQIYTIIGFFLLLVWLIYLWGQYKQDLFKTKRFFALFTMLSVLMASILISFSRSNWVGMFSAFVVLPIIYALSSDSWFKSTLKAIGLTVASTALALGMISILVLFPYPRIDGAFDPTNLLSKRAFTFTGEAGVSSRWQLLPPLWSEVKENTLLGGGFGKTVTYITEDPRIRAQSPTGEYTTFAFEWGYLDLWLKFGLLGLLVYAFLVLSLFWKGFVLLRSQKQTGAFAMDLAINQGLFIGGVALIATHTFSPYLNHPLGIGYLLFWAVTLEILAQNRKTVTLTID